MRILPDAAKYGNKFKVLLNHLTNLVDKEKGLDDAIKIIRDANRNYKNGNGSFTKLLNKTLIYVCELHNCTKTELLNSKKHEIVQARKICYIILRHEFDMPLDDISFIFKKTVSLVSKEISSFLNQSDKDPDLKIRYELVQKKVRELKPKKQE